jgi:diguanylate cyclase (GGDEF)-like protein
MDVPVLGIIPEFRFSAPTEDGSAISGGDGKDGVLKPASKENGPPVTSCPTAQDPSVAPGYKAGSVLPAASLPPDQCVVRAFAELSRETLDSRWQAVSVLIRTIMLAGLKLELEQALSLFCDLVGEIVPYDGGLAFFWEKEQKQLRLRLTRHLNMPAPETLERSNLFNDWARVCQGPVLIPYGLQPEADLLLAEVGAQSLLVVPLFVDTRVLGALQLFGGARNSFTEEDAQFLWMLSLLSEKLFQQDHADEALIELAFTDFLTGLKTRRYFEEQLDREIKRAERNGNPLSLVLIDVDHFKLVNDRFGHQTGDMILREIAARLMKGRREIDTVARYGGEEFTIILPDTNLVGSDHVAQRLCKDIESTGFAVGPSSQVSQLTISLGVASFPRDAKSKSDLLQAADVALYRAKDDGRNRVILYSELDPKQGMRHEQRLTVVLPVRVWGMDVNGELFEHEAVTVDITTTGARLEGITGPLQKGCIVGIQHAISKARYRVAWVGAEGTEVQSQIGLQLVDSGKLIWGRVIPRIFGDDFRRGRTNSSAQIHQIDPLKQKTSDSAGSSEQKLSPRYRCSGSITFHQAGAEHRFHATVSDIEIDDGHLEVHSIAPGTKVSVSLDLDDVR